MAEVVVTRLELYPQDEPTSYAVGFTVSCGEGKSFYMDTTIPLSDAADSETAVNLAYEKMKDTINEKVAALTEKPAIIGKVFKVL